MLARPASFVGGQMSGGPGPRNSLDQDAIDGSQTTAGNATLTAQQICQGVLNRTGPGAGFTDTFPDADTVVAVLDNPQKGDSWFLWYRNAVAFAMTFAAGVGVVSGIGTLGVAASSTKLYLLTLLSVKRTKILVGSNTNASAILTGFNNADIANIEPGMGVTGTGIAASSVVLGVTPSDSVGGATVTLNNNCTSSNSNVAFTFFPRYQVDAIGVMTN